MKRARGRPFDATLKALVDLRPGDWLALLGVPTPQHVEVVDTDLSTYSGVADKVLRVSDAEGEWIQHLEPQASPAPDIDDRVLAYQSLLRLRHRLPVDSVLILLRPEADVPRVHGRVYSWSPRGRCRIEFDYDVLRLWEIPAGALVEGGLATLPLATLGNMSGTNLERVIHRLGERLDREADPTGKSELWTATYILMGLRYSPEQVAGLLSGVRNMRESATYQAILREGEQRGLEKGIEKGLERGIERGIEKGLLQGRLDEGRRLLRLFGARRLGEPSAEVLARIEALEDADRIDALAMKVAEVESWAEVWN